MTSSPREWIDRLSLFPLVSKNDLFRSFQSDDRQDGSQVDLTLRVIALHILAWEQRRTLQKVRQLFMTRSVLRNLDRVTVSFFFSFFPPFSTRQPSLDNYRPVVLFLDRASFFTHDLSSVYFVE